MTFHGVKPLLQRIAAGDSLSASESRSVLEMMTGGYATPAQMGAYLMALRVRGETIDEITGAALMMRGPCRPLANGLISKPAGTLS